jgi:hypothetical protein
MSSASLTELYITDEMPFYFRDDYVYNMVCGELPDDLFDKRYVIFACHTTCGADDMAAHEANQEFEGDDTTQTDEAEASKLSEASACDPDTTVGEGGQVIVDGIIRTEALRGKYGEQTRPGHWYLLLLLNCHNLGPDPIDDYA